MEFLNGNILKPCNPKAGIKSVKLAEWKRDLFYEKAGNELTNIQELVFYEFQSPIMNYVSTLDNSDEGEFYSISIDFEVSQLSKEKSKDLGLISNLQLVAVLQDEYGNDVIFGLENGLTPKISETTGGSKSSFSGYNISLTGEQREEPLFSQLFSATSSSVLTIDGMVLTINEKVLQL